jgi:DNA replication and repair protein RecF
VWVERLWLHDFRNYEHAELELDRAVTLVVGGNGQGKTNLVEAIAYLGSLQSFRGVGADVLVREGATQAVVRAEVRHESGRELLVEAEVAANGRSRAQVNRQPVRRHRDLLGLVRVTVFSPDDLEIVKGGPSARRNFVDELAIALNPSTDRLRLDVERIVRQRTALLRQAGGRLDTDALTTLDVWDHQLAEAGTALGDARASVVDALATRVPVAYHDLGGARTNVQLAYAPAWRTGGLAAALVAARRDDVRRSATTIGPHRDDLAVTLNGRNSRTHASQGEQRSLALALRLAGHDLVHEVTSETPVLVLDDVFSELDPHRSRSLVDHLPPAQVVVTTAGAVPDGVHPASVVHVCDGRLS